MNIQEQIAANRDFCKSPFAKERELSDQQKRLPQPPLCKPAQSERRILLGRDFRSVMTQTDFFTILQKRTSQRFYRDEEMSLEQLSFLLWATQGVKSIRGDHYATLRTVPSGGARHAFETYLAVRKVAGLSAGVYHYLPLEHALEPVGPLENPREQITAAMHGQKWAGGCAVAFLYSFVPVNQRCSFSELLAKQNAAKSKNGNAGRSGNTAPTAPRAKPIQPKITYKSFFIFTLIPPVVFSLFSIRSHGKPPSQDGKTAFWARKNA